ncbi:MAG: hypothetical protein JNM81_00155 [Rhodospirillaceae bacterium]|nr:hypothetical protein [Rhodospirillaceae bacterium]
MRSNARRRVLLGPFGSGKSTACCMELWRRAKTQAPDAHGVRRTRFAIVRNTYPELKSTTLKTWMQWLGQGASGVSTGAFTQSAPMEHRLRVTLRDKTNVHCDVMFLAMDQESDVKKFLSLEVTGIWFNEVRELKRSIVDAGDGRIGRFPSMRDGGPTWHGLIADSNMPDEDHWLYDVSQGADDGAWRVFRQPGGVVKVGDGWVQNPKAENLKHLVPQYYGAQTPGKADAWIAVYLGAEFGRLPQEGAYYADELMLAEREGRMADLVPDPSLPVHTFWDLGIADDTAIWFGQASCGGQWRWIDYVEGAGQALDYYARILREKASERRFVYGDHVWPHDGGHRDPGILGGKTRRDVFEGLGFKTIILPKHSLADGIDAVRRLIRVSHFSSSHCGEGLKKLRRYKREFDAARGVYEDRPRHDDASHAADAFRAAAMGQGRVSNVSAWTGVELKDAGEWVV